MSMDKNESAAPKELDGGKEREIEEIAKKRWLAKGIYKSKDVPIRLLDGLILGILAVVVILVILFAVNGGYTISFETEGGTSVDAQRLRYGTLIERPETPQKPGYVLVGWKTSLDESVTKEWNFEEDKVEGDMTLYTVWSPVEITVKFDLDSGNWQGAEVIPDARVTFGELYGNLPVPVREGYRFGGWFYSGNAIVSDTQVSTNGEHVLTARWIAE